MLALILSRSIKGAMIYSYVHVAEAGIIEIHAISDTHRFRGESNNPGWFSFQISVGYVLSDLSGTAWPQYRLQIQSHAIVVFPTSQFDRFVSY